MRVVLVVVITKFGNSHLLRLCRAGNYKEFTLFIVVVVFIDGSYARFTKP